ncbi:transcriptional regulator [Candidatus Desantisbacteria bacterium]|nr:transcriptional regulator [Candidatus Desantisbacteria bacterium]
MVIKPIKNNKDYEKALKKIEEIFDTKKNTPQGDELEILSILVEHYEQQHYPIVPPDPIEAIKFRMEQMGLKNSDLAPYLGGRNRVSEILNKKRHLTVKMIKSLYINFNIPAESLIG